MFRRLASIIGHPSLRVRLTSWYVLLLGVTSVVIGGLFYLELQRSLYASADLSLRAALAQAAATIETETDTAPQFRSRNDVDIVVRNRGRSNFAVRLLAEDGRVAEGAGAYLNGPRWPKALAGFATVGGRGGSWRVLTEPIVAKERPVLGWIQVAQPVDSIITALRRLRELLVLAIPLMLLLAGAGGVLLAHEGLKPIAAVTGAAQTISSSDLSRRIAYTGPEDELARLSRTFDGMLDRLEEGFELERRFTADASHELRTPLTALKGQIDVALSKDRSEREYREILSSLAKEADRMIRLTNDLLLLSRIGLDGVETARERVNLSDLVLASADQMTALAESKGISTTVSGGERSIEVLGDFDQLVRLFLNLLDNAVKYTPKGGEIGVVLSLPQLNRARVEITNTGPGFPPEHAEQVFERFYRVDRARSRDGGGSGLGLAIAHEIVRAHGGRIHAASRPGRQTTFTVELPAELAT